MGEEGPQTATDFTLNMFNMLNVQSHVAESAAAIFTASLLLRVAGNGCRGRQKLFESCKGRWQLFNHQFLAGHHEAKRRCLLVLAPMAHGRDLSSERFDEEGAAAKMKQPKWKVSTSATAAR